MKNLSKKTVTMLSVAILSSVFVFSCKDKDDDTPEDNQPKTLNKDLLVGKIWYNKGGTIAHDIRANGVYYERGTWEWKNGGDTLIVDLDGSGSVHSSVEWKIFWTAEHEMACRQAKTGTTEILYKDQPW